MSSIVQLLDPTGAVIFDLNDDSGAVNPGGVQTTFGVGGGFGLMSPATEFTQFSPPAAAGGFTTYVRDPLVLSTWTQRIIADSYDALAIGVGALSRYLRAGGTIKFVPDGSVETRYIDFEPSPAPVIFKGDSLELFKALRLFQSQTVPMQVWRQPYLRGPQLDSAQNALGNASTMLVAVAVAGRPDGWSWVSTTNITAESIDAATESYKWNHATTGSRTLRSDYTTVTAAPGDVWSASIDVWAETSGIAFPQVAVEFVTGAGASIGGGVTSSTAVTVGPNVQRLTVTSAAAPATTANVRMQLVFVNLAATAVNIHARRPQLEHAASVSKYRVGTLSISNNPTLAVGRILPIWNPGDAPSSGVLQIKQTDSAAHVQAIQLNAKSSKGIPGGGRLADLMSGGISLNLSGGTLGTDTTDNDDTANGSAGHVAKCTFATFTAVRRVSRITTSAALSSLRGQTDIYLRVRADGAGVFGLQLRWGAGTGDPAPVPAPEVLHDTSNAAAFGYVDLFVGSIRLPDTTSAIGQLAFEVWGRRISGSGSIYANFLSYAPSDVPSSLVYMQGVSTETWVGSDLATALTNSDEAKVAGTATLSGLMNLNALNEGAGTPPNTGFVWGAARHVVTFVIETFQPSLSGAKIGEIRVRNITDSADVAGTVVNVNGSTTSAWNTVTYTVQFDGVGGKAYQAQVVHTANNTEVIDVRTITHQNLYSAGQNQYFRTDPKRGVVELLDSSLNLLQSVRLVGPVPITLDPGLTLVYCHFVDIPLVGYNEGQSAKSRLVSGQVLTTPNYYG